MKTEQERMKHSPLSGKAPPSNGRQRLWKLYGRTLALFLAMVAGALFPQGQAASGIVPYLLMGMLFFAFLDISFTRESFHAGILWVFLSNLAVPFAVYFLIRGWDPDLALVGFLTAIAPTATATPVIVSYLHGRVDYVLTLVLVTNVGIALVLPFVLPWAAGATVRITTAEVLPSVLEVMFLPLILAYLLRRFLPSVQRLLLPAKAVSFPIWLTMLFIVMAKASAFLQSNRDTPISRLAWIALIALGSCIVNFALGALIGGRTFRREASQSLGQKNNSFTIWIALTYLHPLAALGPTFYVLYHNLYNGLQLYLAERGNAE
jgi:BASS family bile acid:Na+ symporter